MIASHPSLTASDVGVSMHALAAELFPICRSIAGPGLRQTLQHIARHLSGLVIHEVPTGTPLFDWVAPREWSVRDAYIQDRWGRRIVDFRDCNLHVVNYSAPVHKTVTLSELRPHLHTSPEHPHAVPYCTAYYHDHWGFCLSQAQLDQLDEGPYEVFIDAEHRPGSLSYGELILPGQEPGEVLFSSHACHPSLANDNLSGIAVAVHLARLLAGRPRRYTYRFLFAPATIGAIAWLAANPQAANRVRHGLVLTLLGDSGHSTYKRSRRGQAEIDRAVEHVLLHSGQPYEIAEFVPFGYDERQFCSPGFNLPVGCLMRTPFGKYPEYHTSADNLELIQPEHLADSLSKCVSIVETLEHNRIYRNLRPHGEPQLGRRGLYSALGGRNDKSQLERAMLWVLNWCDGTRDLLAVAQQAELPFSIVREAAELLVKHELLGPLAETTPSKAAPAMS